MPTKHLVILGLTVVAVIGIPAASFYFGQRYEAKRDTVLIANEGCFDCLMGLNELKSTNRTDAAKDLDSEMDLTAMMLADMTLEHPHLIGALQYGLLCKVRDYRMKYGRGYQYDQSFQPNPAVVDRKIADAIAYLESIHGTNGDYWYAWHDGSRDAYLDQQTDKAKHGR
jgi:hypothetical protein